MAKIGIVAQHGCKNICRRIFIALQLLVRLCLALDRIIFLLTLAVGSGHLQCGRCQQIKHTPKNVKSEPRKWNRSQSFLPRIRSGSIHTYICRYCVLFDQIFHVLYKKSNIRNRRNRDNEVSNLRQNLSSQSQS